MKKSTNEILALLRGEPGPFLETETSYYGKKQTDSSMKDARMETDLGGAMISRAKMTYGEADTLAPQVDLVDYPAFVRGLQPSAYWRSPYEKPQPEGVYFLGEVWWSICSYMATKGYIEVNPRSYNNAMEYLYNEVLKRLVNAGVYEADAEWRWFTFKLA